MIDKAALHQTADRGIREVALALLATAEDTGSALTGSADALRAGAEDADDLLHDFRVAIRRLRSWLRAFKGPLSDALPKKQRRRLSAIVRDTNAARDAAVHVEWLKKNRRDLAAQRRAGYNWMHSRLQKRRMKGLDTAVAAAENFAAVAPKLRESLDLDDAKDVSSSPLFGIMLADVIGDAADKLKTRLAKIRRSNDIMRIHRARIAAKRLRYVVEPVAALGIDGQLIVDSLKSLQDSFGDLHDVHVFSAQLARASRKAAKKSDGGAPEDPQPGLVHIAHKLHARGEGLYATIAREWLGKAGDPFFEKVRVFASDLSR